MAGTGLLTDPRNDPVLEESIRERGHLVLTHREATGWRTCKATFVAGSRSDTSVTVKRRPDGDSLSATNLTLGDTLGVTFRAGHGKCMFSTVLERLQAGPDGLLLTLRWPDEIQRLQRRVYQRATPPKDTVVAVRFWRDTPTAGAAGREPAARYGQLEDLSAGGMRIKAADPDDLEMDAPYRCSFSPRAGAPAIVLEATLRHREVVDQGRASLGFQFLGLETSAEGRRALTRLARIVSTFHQKGRSSSPAR